MVIKMGILGIVIICCIIISIWIQTNYRRYQNNEIDNKNTTLSSRIKVLNLICVDSWIYALLIMILLLQGNDYSILIVTVSAVLLCMVTIAKGIIIIKSLDYIIEDTTEQAFSRTLIKVAPVEILNIISVILFVL